MKPQMFRVNSIEFIDRSTKQLSVEFESVSGTKFKCFSDGYCYQEGEVVEISHIYWIAGDLFSIERLFDSNLSCEYAMEQRAEWDYFCKGRVVAVEGGTIFVDCGGVLIPLEGVTDDQSIIGSWIGFAVERLEVERAVTID